MQAVPGVRVARLVAPRLLADVDAHALMSTPRVCRARHVPTTHVTDLQLVPSYSLPAVCVYVWQYASFTGYWLLAASSYARACSIRVLVTYYGRMVLMRARVCQHVPGGGVDASNEAWINVACNDNACKDRQRNTP